MQVPIPVPQLGVVEEVIVIEWLFTDGELVREGDAVVIIETEKVDTELPSPASGTLRIVVPVSDNAIPTGTVLGYVQSG